MLAFGVVPGCLLAIVVISAAIAAATAAATYATLPLRSVFMRVVGGGGSSDGSRDDNNSKKATQLQHDLQTIRRRITAHQLEANKKERELGLVSRAGIGAIKIVRRGSSKVENQSGRIQKIPRRVEKREDGTNLGR